MFASTVTKMCLSITNHPHFEWLPQCYHNMQPNYRLVTFWMYPVLGPPYTLSRTCRFHSEYAPRSIQDVFGDHIPNVVALLKVFNICPKCAWSVHLDTLRSHDWVYSKGTQYLPHNYIKFTFMGIFQMCPIFYHWVSSFLLFGNNFRLDSFILNFFFSLRLVMTPHVLCSYDLCLFLFLMFHLSHMAKRSHYCIMIFFDFGVLLHGCTPTLIFFLYYSTTPILTINVFIV